MVVVINAVEMVLGAGAGAAYWQQSSSGDCILSPSAIGKGRGWFPGSLGGCVASFLCVHWWLTSRCHGPEVTAWVGINAVVLCLVGQQRVGRYRRAPVRFLAWPQSRLTFEEHSFRASMAFAYLG